jgi:hypothetical protein
VSALAPVEAGEKVIAKVEVNLDPDRFEVGPEGRRAWLREARRDLEVRREENPWPGPRSRPTRLLEAKRRMDEELAVEHAANQCTSSTVRLWLIGWVGS